MTRTIGLGHIDTLAMAVWGPGCGNFSCLTCAPRLISRKAAAICQMPLRRDEGGYDFPLEYRKLYRFEVARKDLEAWIQRFWRQAAKVNAGGLCADAEDGSAITQTSSSQTVAALGAEVDPTAKNDGKKPYVKDPYGFLPSFSDEKSSQTIAAQQDPATCVARWGAEGLRPHAYVAFKGRRTTILTTLYAALPLVKADKKSASKTKKGAKKPRPRVSYRTISGVENVRREVRELTLNTYQVAKDEFSTTTVGGVSSSDNLALAPKSIGDLASGSRAFAEQPDVVCPQKAVKRLKAANVPLASSREFGDDAAVTTAPIEPEDRARIWGLLRPNAPDPVRQARPPVPPPTQAQRAEQVAEHIRAAEQMLESAYPPFREFAARWLADLRQRATQVEQDQQVDADASSPLMSVGAFTRFLMFALADVSEGPVS